jgi:hypothetical protein
MEIELSSGVETLLKRMQTNPEEFFGEAKRWSFMFREHFRDVMTEAEKGAIHQGMKEVRRIEFDVLVVKELLREEQEQTMAEQAQMASHQGGPFGAIPKPEGGLIRPHNQTYKSK